MTVTEQILSGFENPVFTSQTTFRTILAAMAQPGSKQPLSEVCTGIDQLNATTLAILLSLADYETPVWICPSLRTDKAADFLRFQTGCSVTEDASESTFAIVSPETNLADIANISTGTPEYPDQSTSLIINVDETTPDNSNAVTLEGPGIESKKTIHLASMPTEFWSWREQVNTGFPCGVDLIFASPTEISAIPRSTKMEF